MISDVYGTPIRAGDTLSTPMGDYTVYERNGSLYIDGVPLTYQDVASYGLAIKMSHEQRKEREQGEVKA